MFFDEWDFVFFDFGQSSKIMSDENETTKEKKSEEFDRQREKEERELKSIAGQYQKCSQLELFLVVYLCGSFKYSLAPVEALLLKEEEEVCVNDCLFFLGLFFFFFFFFFFLT